MWVRQWVMAGYVLAMALVGFAHHGFAAAGSSAPLNLSAYALPDGSLPSICFDDAGRRNDRTAQHSVCDACLLTAGPGLAAADAAASFAAPLASRVVVFIPAATNLAARPAHVAHLRGPPVTVSQDT
jgi:hypothetical protein